MKTYKKDKVFFTSTVNNNGIEELKKYILKRIGKLEILSERILKFVN